MSESIVQINEGTGKKLHTFNRTIGANTVEDEVVLLGESYLPTYSLAIAPSVATLNQHIFQIMAGSSLRVRIRRIVLYPFASTGAGNAAFAVLRLTTAGTGGSAATPSPYDPADPASGATAMSGVVTPGTEGVPLLRMAMAFTAAAPQAGNFIEWKEEPNQKPIIIAAGTTNGICIKNLVAITGGSTQGYIEFDESSF